MNMTAFEFFFAYTSAILLIVILFFGIRNYYKKFRWKSAQKYIERYDFPQEVVRKWKAHYPTISNEQTKKGMLALKQFFLIIAHSKIINGKSPKEGFDMPSIVVDKLWHEFILSSQEYTRFCNHAYGSYLHHQQHSEPKYKDLRDKNISPGLLNTYKASTDMNIGMIAVGTLPLIFALDQIVDSANGFHYDLTNMELQAKLAQKQAGANSDAGSGGCNAGFSTMMFTSDSGSCSDSGSSCGGGCGGGGGD